MWLTVILKSFLISEVVCLFGDGNQSVLEGSGLRNVKDFKSEENKVTTDFDFDQFRLLVKSLKLLKVCWLFICDVSLLFSVSAD